MPTAYLHPDIPMADYVADRVGDLPPTLSSSIAHKLLTRSPLHAWAAHPRLNPAWRQESDPAFDLGTAMHAVLLEGKELTVVPFDSYRSNAAKAARDEIIASGGIPAKPEEAEAVGRMVASAQAKLGACPDIAGLLGSEHIEITAVWQESGSWLRCRPDMMTAGYELILSLKTTRGSADPDAFLRSIIGLGYHTQAAFELAAIKAVRGIDAAYAWLAVEDEPPYAASLTGMSPMLLDLAHSTLVAAIRRWAECLASDTWPAYSERIAYLEPPAWASAAFIQRHGYAPAPDDNRPIEEVMFERGILP